MRSGIAQRARGGVQIPPSALRIRPAGRKKDQQGRTGDITTYSLAAGAIVALGPFQTEGWRQSDGNLYAVASHIDVKFSVLYLP